MTEKTLIIPHAELVAYGCKNCVWKLHGQCPHNIKDDEIYSFTESIKISESLLRSNPIKDTKYNTIKGYCPEFSDFLCQFAEGEDTISAVWEKFSIYMAKLQSMEDYTAYKNLCVEVVKLEADLKTLTDDEKERLAYLQNKQTSLKVWWSKLNSQVLFSLSKVVDREKRQSLASSAPKIYIQGGGKSTEVNFTPKKQLESDKK